ncbi:hypothetical protein GGR32_000517 [Mesonia hippocampi]|uniref:Lipoprotein n=1 Tax=Mesonia hippocampi TaxID=1628250 RepID=A0A840ENQ7_9FLAO|nr:hypothetical protein [Mesonia hippocampi]MBB4118243.1 hypothetical protein [Mesonia hippocampi]
MKKILVTLMVFSAVLTACKNETKTTEAQKEAKSAIANEKEKTQILKGEFLYMADAAVLKGDDFIYGVVLDSMVMKLSKKVAPFKKDDYDMIPVIVRGVIKPNLEEGWDEVLEIKEILNVSKPEETNLIKLEAKQPEK